MSTTGRSRRDRVLFVVSALFYLLFVWRRGWLVGLDLHPHVLQVLVDVLVALVWFAVVAVWVASIVQAVTFFRTPPPAPAVEPREPDGVPDVVPRFWLVCTLVGLAALVVVVSSVLLSDSFTSRVAQDLTVAAGLLVVVGMAAWFRTWAVARAREVRGH